jgi:hypothetical protein
MEEDEYKSTYAQIASVRCVFEKALTNNLAKCSYSRHFWLADREGYACKSEDCARLCTDLLRNLRENSRFSLKLKTVGNALPHNMDIRVQAGGLQGLQDMLNQQSPVPDIDVRVLVATAIEKYGGLDVLPYNEIIQSVASFKGRRRRSRKGEV